MDYELFENEKQVSLQRFNKTFLVISLQCLMIAVQVQIHEIGIVSIKRENKCVFVSGSKQTILRINMQFYCTEEKQCMAGKNLLTC